MRQRSSLCRQTRAARTASETAPVRPLPQWTRRGDDPDPPGYGRTVTDRTMFGREKTDMKEHLNDP